MHHAALSALSCIHEDIKHYRAAALIEPSVAATLRALASWLPHYTRKNVRQAFETLIQVVLCVPICIEDNDLIQVPHPLPHARTCFPPCSSRVCHAADACSMPGLLTASESCGLQQNMPVL